MIKNITITNDLGESIRLDLADPWSSGFIIKSITGLGPPKANIFFTEMVTSDGALDNSARLESRDITLNLMFLENPTIEDTRLNSYKYFPIKRNVTFKIETDYRVCETVGRIESNEPDIFSKEEGCQIVIRCPDSYFHSIDPITGGRTIFYGVDPLFEFAFENESLTEPLLEFGNISSQPERTVVYTGDAPIGVTFNIHMLGPAFGIRIYDVTSRQMIQIDDTKLGSIIEDGLLAGDDILISTEKGKKEIRHVRAGYSTNIMNCLIKPLQWPQLQKGDNLFVMTAEEGLDNIQMVIENEILYEGV